MNDPTVLDHIDHQRRMMTDLAAARNELPATSEQIHYLADLIGCSHAGLWNAFGTLTRGTASLIISGVVDARDYDEEAAA